VTGEGRSRHRRATSKLPAWLADPLDRGRVRRPARARATLELGGKRVELGDAGFGLGVRPSRGPTASRRRRGRQAGLVHARGNLRFASDGRRRVRDRGRDRQRRIADSRILQAASAPPRAS
jgi:hypothetical protein